MLRALQRQRGQLQRSLCSRGLAGTAGTQQQQQQSQQGQQGRGLSDGTVARFYEEVSVVPAAQVREEYRFHDGWMVALDGRVLRTPARAELLLPTQPLAMALAAEFGWQVGWSAG